MAHLTAAGTDAAGLGTRSVRYTMVAVWALGNWSLLLKGLPPETAPALLLSVLLSLVAALLITTPGGRPLPLRHAVGAAATAYVSAVLIVLVTPPVTEVWAFNFPVYLLALLMVRGNMREGACGGVLAVATGIGAALVAGVSLSETALFVGLPVLALVVAVIWARALDTAVERERAHLSEASLAELEASATEAATAAEQELISEVRREAEPVLTLIRDGELIDDSVAQDIAVAEGSIRDRLRPPLLSHPRINDSVRLARQRRVQVVLLGSDASEQSALDDALAGAVADRIDRVADGSVTVRALPPGRGAAISVLVEGNGLLERWLLGTGGEVVGRH